MEFFLPSDVFAFEQPMARCASRRGANAHPACSFDAAPLFASPFFDAIRQQEAAQARAEAIQRAKAARRRAQEEREARAYLEHLLHLQQREELLRRQQEAHRQYQLHQLQLQRQRQQQAAREEYRRRQQYAEYQRRKAQAIEQERRRIAAAKHAEDQSRHLFLALEDLLFGGLSFDDDGHRELASLPLPGPSRSTAVKQSAPQQSAPQQSAPQQPAPQSASQSATGKGKAKAVDEAGQDEDMEPALDTLLGTSDVISTPSTTDDKATASKDDAMAIDQDPEEVGPSPSEAPADAAPAQPEADQAAPAAAAQPEDKKDLLVFSHSFPAGNSAIANKVQASDIRISVDEQTNTVTVAGLWDDKIGAASPIAVARPSSPTPSTSSRKGRSRSPKRARVSDVDANGDEIIRNDDEDDYVEISSAGGTESDSEVTSPATEPHQVEKCFQLPAGARAEDLRAELHQDGLRLFVSSRA
ncbi:uncharacterized protein PFL1_00154 [Pseudozyma flocculosa PF-1]|uniref:Uncharacterized protein n=1 Tax=Pseudozyma flocculosa TaxID=84751 RepID=A0A5C3EVL6_9BASI|nr:uncharacterized protein PFL1_00154 [Pseudozyma flocculosa PF-1]EPQ31955.1 hypothetical protein PFL1_00154 [Pseudozyma flocculosa PF-1]SPO35131.1 uncharacterized protein PSFLO_00602 [Pseudozyma flocculosa]